MQICILSSIKNIHTYIHTFIHTNILMRRFIGLQSPAEGDEDEGGRVDPERARRAAAREVRT